MTSSRLLNGYDFPQAKLSDTNQQDIKQVQQPIMHTLFSGFSNSVFFNPYIIGLVTIIITSLVGKYLFFFNFYNVKCNNCSSYYILFSVYCYGFSFNTKYIPLIKSKHSVHNNYYFLKFLKVKSLFHNIFCIIIRSSNSTISN